jgi:FAD/FMN-containing dehydrogenase
MQSFETLVNELQQILGPEAISLDPEELARAGADIFPFPAPAAAALVVSPRSADELALVAKAARREGVALVPRGAALSYTRGFAPTQPAVVVDTQRLDHIEIHQDDLFAVVGSGVSWQALAEQLSPFGLRSVVPGPISGAVSTVGGAVSQYVPGSMEGVLGLTVVLADGTVVRTGSGARRDASPFHRHAGPDLTGLFIGDCGALGVKTEVVLRLTRIQPAAFASFAYQDVARMIDDIIEIRAAGWATRVLALDQSRGEDVARVDTAEAVQTARAVASAASSPLAALRDVASLVKGRASLAGARWSLHLTAEAPTPDIANALIGLARKRCAIAAREVDATVPKALHARPYSIRGFVGVEGERWVPVHGMLPPSRARSAMDELEAIIGSRAEAMARAGVRHSFLISAPGPYVTIEPMFFWLDELDPLHLRHLSERNRKRFEGRPVNLAARELVSSLRAELRECYERHDATHAQMGRFYRHAERLDPGSRELLQRIKNCLDPSGQINPGVLGL